MDKQELEKLSDDELNAKLARFLGFDVASSVEDNDYYFIKEKDGSWKAVPDYCNKPSDIMPEAFKRKLSFTHIGPEGNYNCACISEESVDCGCVYYAHINPLRAAVIVIILMGQSK